MTQRELALATNNFSSLTKVGHGGYGNVYKGILSGETLVAIKRAAKGSIQGQKEFLTEIEFLSRLHHRNLVSLIGYCDEEDTHLPLISAKMESDALTWGDKLILRGLSFHGFHGAKPEERTLGQKFLVDIDAWMDLKAAGKSDHLSDTVSYTEIYDVAKEVLEGSPHNLLESVAHKIAITTLTNHKQISVVRVKVGKPHVAVRGPVDYLGVDILRRRSDLSG